MRLRDLTAEKLKEVNGRATTHTFTDPEEVIRAVTEVGKDLRSRGLRTYHWHGLSLTIVSGPDGGFSKAYLRTARTYVATRVELRWSSGCWRVTVLSKHTGTVSVGGYSNIYPTFEQQVILDAVKEDRRARAAIRVLGK